MADHRLFESTICRLCSEVDDNGELLFNGDSTTTEICDKINRYLPLKIQENKSLPRTICSGCNIQLEATIQFFELLVSGQSKLQEFVKRKSEKENGNRSEDRQSLLNISADGTVYAATHSLSLQMQGLDKPRKRRGRPPKVQAKEEVKDAEEIENYEGKFQEEEEEDKDEAEEGEDGRKKRKRKMPKRYSESVRGKELDKIFRDEGSREQIVIKSEPIENDVIGHIESADADKMILVHMSKSRPRTKPTASIDKDEFRCRYCNRNFLDEDKFKAHQSLHEEQYYCTECNKSFCDWDRLHGHQINTGHKGEKFFDTKDIDKNVQTNFEKSEVEDDGEQILPDVEDYSNDENNGDNLFKCLTCGKVYVTEENLERHIKVAHEGEKPFSCEICDKLFAYESSLKGHVEIVHKSNSEEKSNSYLCDDCGKNFESSSSLVHHRATEHCSGYKYVCNACSKNFKNKQLLQRHQLVHSDERPHSCKLCDASFKTKANLLNHQSTHTGEKKHICEICGQQFAHKTSLTLHYRWHTGQKPYKCDVCSKTFSQNGNLQEHLRIHTGEKPYCCDFCGRKFTTSSQFKLHVKRHTGERPWKCEFCSKSFLHKDTWKCHVRRHKGERPFSCQHCDRGFTEQWALKKHLRLHTGEKPYSCEFCGRKFADCSNLAKHKKVHIAQTVFQNEEPDQAEDWQNQQKSKKNINVLTKDDCDKIDEDDSKIIYLSYEDSENVENLGDQVFEDNVLGDSEEQINEEMSQIQVSDHAIAVSLSLEQVKQLLSETNGQLTSLVNPEVITPDQQNCEKIDTDSQQILEIKNQTDLPQIGTLGDQIEFSEEQSAVEFMTHDGQKFQLVDLLRVDPDSEYLSIA